MNSDIKLYKGFVKSGAANVLLSKFCRDIQFQYTLKQLKGGNRNIKRGMAYISDSAGWYKFAGVALKGTSWKEHEYYPSFLRSLVSRHIGIEFNSVLLNYYRNGKDEIRWHSDKEEILGENPIIACLNLGASRHMHFLRKTETREVSAYKTSYLLESGDLLVMGRNCQQNWMHAIMPEKHVKSPRLSLTFRKTYEI
jgi:alkylated DNA repair dioxygenase AlkB